MADLTRLQQIMQRLRDPDNGCPWDRAQNFLSIVPHTIEEAYEVAASIESGALDELPAELGDLLFQVIFYAQLAHEASVFTLDDVVSALEDKLVRRHPHVFSEGSGQHDVNAVKHQWEAHKAAERQQRDALSELDDVPVALPALSRAAKLQKRASRVGFDWPDRHGARAKLSEELAEFDAAVAAGDRAQIADELGDVLFSVVNLSRHCELDAEAALRAASGKFERRFRAIESELKAQGTDIAASDEATLEALWQVQKEAEKNAGA